MGDFYEVVFLGDKVFMVYQNDGTNWQQEVIELNSTHVSDIEAFRFEQAEREQEFLKGIADQYAN